MPQGTGEISQFVRELAHHVRHGGPALGRPSGDGFPRARQVTDDRTNGLRRDIGGHVQGAHSATPPSVGVLALACRMYPANSAGL